jgi:hypothetical protein
MALGTGAPARAAVSRYWIGIAMGAFEQPTGTRLRIHIHVADKGDYYDIGDGLPQNQHQAMSV